MLKAVERSLADRDRGLLWHPYEALDGDSPYAVEEADGVTLSLRAPTGELVHAIDGMSSWWCAVHGYRNARLDRAVIEQVSRFSHVMFGGLTHEPAVELAERLVALTPDGLDHVFIADSGSVSVEVALKLAVQYQAARNHPERRRILTVRGGYHGDTTGAMSVCDPVGGMHSQFSGLVADQLFVAPPPAARFIPAGEPADSDINSDGAASGSSGNLPAGSWSSDTAEVDRWISELQEAARLHRHELAGVIVEPVLQGAGGMRTYDPRCLKALRELADELDLVFIADEIATGFGRTGAWFACEWADIVPDVMCMGKALTGGYMTLAAVLVSRRVAAVITDSPQRALMHGPTFMANPLACAVANESLAMLEDSWRTSVTRQNLKLQEILPLAMELPGVADVRVIGAVGIIEFHEVPDRDVLTRTALKHGVWLRPFGKLLYAMPPYICTERETERIGQAMVAAARAVESTTVAGRVLDVGVEPNDQSRAIQTGAAS
ncbi:MULTISPECIES: adenosylmethionine--8-amino-7-oxononanoate transaminase [Kocuria]|uniref:Adenosylmethionine-8-amino-7-oxononanoate aminotransferase n=1 Tax=Kocuria atrinae TaxID=592377 RepID=A0ABN2XIB3_9MICC|nr:adenosylmethionine--8-amino-7-oxononanoate transaminase [Kocuria carniphila]MCT1803209.1 adenosylmethionine--8-amino-7-oxononanoate transaminase [Kocuria carniphila]